MGELAKQSGRPSAIINIGWDQAFAGIADESGQFYSTTKGAIMAMTGSLAKALSKVKPAVGQPQGSVTRLAGQLATLGSKELISRC